MFILYFQDQDQPHIHAVETLELKIFIYSRIDLFMHILWLSTCSHSVKATTFEGIGFVFVFQYLLTYPLVIALFVSWVIKFSSDIIFIPFTDLLSINISCSADILMTNSPKFSEKKFTSFWLFFLLLFASCFHKHLLLFL